VPLAQAGVIADNNAYANNSQGSWYTLQRDRAVNRPATATTDLRPVK
jgi:hypothetical protein